MTIEILIKVVSSLVISQEPLATKEGRDYCPSNKHHKRLNLYTYDRSMTRDIFIKVVSSFWKSQEPFTSKPEKEGWGLLSFQ